ncbi:hypothetical protein Ciccas_011307 [Cichlidogyrus casuarinus]|uniref:Uncharacterized protein n=1 Tax=Cichlidogyrus casuarinus TaxID=1844966 RepID=A0ABD2PWD3_9PLAT
MHFIAEAPSDDLRLDQVSGVSNDQFLITDQPQESELYIPPLYLQPLPTLCSIPTTSNQKLLSSPGHAVAPSIDLHTTAHLLRAALRSPTGSSQRTTRKSHFPTS